MPSILSKEAFDMCGEAAWMQGKVEIAGVNTARLPVLKNEETLSLLRRA